MEQKSLTFEELSKNWWWNRAEIRRDGVRGVDWPLVEEAARNYELLRRSSKGKQFTQTYLELDREKKAIVHKLWVNWAQWAYRPVFDPKQFNEIGWTPVVSPSQHRQWNLRMADLYLIEEFIREIRLLRQFQGIPDPHPNKGKKYRGVSWKLVEVLDRKVNGIGKFDSSERHTLTDARRRAEKYFIKYERALAEWHKGSLSPDFDMAEQP
jgi:phage anti-repressor protein